jgi:hypothetical protein
MTDLEQEMAENFYGFGSWDAPYWFIGPEQGQGKKEKDNLGPRTRAWVDCGKPDLGDLKDFHDRLKPGYWTEEGAPLQNTWRKLMLILLTSLGKNIEKENIRTYQRLNLGRRDGQTCLIELSGLPANSSRTERDRNSFLQKRIKLISQKLVDHKPKFVVMYGKGSQNSFTEIIGYRPELDKVTFIGSTAILFTKHTNARKLSDEYWRGHGKVLISLAESAKQEEK